MLHQVAAAVTLFLSAILFGSMLFFAAIVTPAAFNSLDKQHVGQYLQVLFPRYYTWGLVLSIVAVLSSMLISWALVTPVILVLLGFIFARQWLMPKIDHYRVPAREGDPDAQIQFKRLHGLSVMIHLAQMVLLMVTFVVTWRGL